MHHAEDDAMSMIAEALMNWPQDARLHLLRGAIHAQRGEASAARGDFSQAIILDPGQHAARYMLGHLELVEGQLAQAIAIWAPLSALDHSAMGHFARGMTDLAAGRTQEALVELRGGLSLSTDDALASFFRSTVAAIERSFSEAQSTIAPDNEKEGSHYLLSEYLSSGTQH
jgi:Flp pilus assembly protein TadD